MDGWRNHILTVIIKILTVLLVYLPQNTQLLRWRGILKFSVRNHQGALEDFNKARKLQPNNASTLTRQGATKAILYYKGQKINEKLGSHEEVLHDLNKVAQSKSNDADILWARGNVKRLLERFEEALDDFDRADRLQPNNAAILRDRGVTKRRLNNHAGSIEDLNRANLLLPNDAFLLRNRGMAKRGVHDHAGALEDLNRADEIEPNNALTLRNRGATKRSMLDYEGALEDLNLADKIEGDNIFTLRNRAIVNFYLRKNKQSLDDINRVLEKNPDNIECREWKQRIEEHTPFDSRLGDDSTPPSGDLEIPFKDIKIKSSQLGEGGHGEVSLANWCNVDVALKKAKCTAKDLLLNEAKTLMSLRYKFIVTLMGISTDPQTSNLYLIMEYMKGGSLNNLLFTRKVKLSRLKVLSLALNIAKGINFLHSHNPKVIHRDLKSSNVLLNSNESRAKISDFGTATLLLSSQSKTTVIGTFGIAMPPEMLAEEQYNEKVDIFSFGVVLYEMLTNKLLPMLEAEPRQNRIKESIQDEELKTLVLDCCKSKANERPCTAEIITRLRELKNKASVVKT